MAESCTLDWVTSVLAVADQVCVCVCVCVCGISCRAALNRVFVFQLLLTRLKELCEHELAKMCKQIVVVSYGLIRVCIVQFHGQINVRMCVHV